MKIVNQETLIPAGLAVLLIGSTATWVSGVRADLRNHADQIETLAKNQEAHVKLVIEINSRLARIEWRLEEESVERLKNK